MNLYKLERNDECAWNEYGGFVVRAENEKEALKLCQDTTMDNCWCLGENYFTDVTIEPTCSDVVGEEEIILTDFLHG